MENAFTESFTNALNKFLVKFLIWFIVSCISLLLIGGYWAGNLTNKVENNATNYTQMKNDIQFIRQEIQK